MSLLDVRRAKEALAWRLKDWGCDDHIKRADAFIDDLIETGWIMNPVRELRPEVPTVQQACPRCGGFAGRCACRVKSRIADDVEPPNPRPTSHADASLARAFMAQNKPNLCGCGVRRDLCPAHREAAMAEEEA
jgi:hypothetical protein